MPIHYHAQSRSFLLQGACSTYAFFLHKRLNTPIHLHWGKRVADAEALVANRVEKGHCMSPGPGFGETTPSLDEVMLELPTFGSGDYRSPALDVSQPDGSRILDLRYSSHRIFSGKPPLAGLPATYVESNDEAESLELELLDRKIGLRVYLLYSVFHDYDVIARSVRIENVGALTLGLDRVLSASIDFPDSAYHCLHLQGSWARERYVRRSPLQTGILAIESRRGSSSHMHNPFLALLEPTTTETAGEAYGMSLVYSGNFIAQAEVSHIDATRVSIGINPFQFHWELRPGESFQSPETILAYSSCGLGGLSHQYHRLYGRRLCRGAYRDAPRPIVINNWEATYFDFDQPKLLSIADKAAAAGIELFVLDDGWFGHRDDDTSSLGDWFADRRKLPDGIEALAAEVCDKGIRFGLWFEPEMVSEDSDLYRKHPDWCLQVEGRRKSMFRNQLVLDLSRAEVRDYLVETVASVLHSARISYVKWDMNRNLTEVGSPSVPSHRQGEVAHRYMLGLYQILETLTARFPHVLFEGCSGGGGRFDPGMLYYFPQIWTSDNTDAHRRQQIQYGTSIVYPPSSISAHVTACPNHLEGRSTPLATRFHTALSGGFGYELDLNKLAADEQSAVARHLAFYKEHRDLFTYGDFHRLISPFENDSCAWIYVSPDRRKAAALYFHGLKTCNMNWKRLRLRGLDAEVLYRVGNQMLRGDYLMHVGLNISEASGDFASELWLIEASV